MSKPKPRSGALWGALLYPESMDLDVARGFLADIGLEVAIGPLHSDDTVSFKDLADWLEAHPEEPPEKAPKVGDSKKPHYHVVIHKPKGNTTDTALLKVLAPLVLTSGPKAGQPAITYLAKLPDLCKATRYLAHLDNPEKAQYDPAEIVYLGGYDPHLVDGNDKSARSRAGLTRILDLVDDYDIDNFYDLRFVLKRVYPEDDDAFDAMVSRATFVKYFMEGRVGSFERALRASGAIGPDLSGAPTTTGAPRRTSH